MALDGVIVPEVVVAVVDCVKVMLVTLSPVTKLLVVLCDKDLIQKIPTKDKKIVNKIQITKKGREVRDLIAPFMQMSRKKYLDDINEDELYVCLRVLSKIKSNLENNKE